MAGEIESGAFLHAAGVRTHVLTSGQDGEPVLLLHGLGSLAQEVLAPFRAAAPRRRFIAPDRPGYGLSDPLPLNPGPIGQAHWLRHLIDALGPGKPPVIVAHSLAAGAALAFATLYPERLGGLVLVAPFCRPTPHALMLGLRLATAPLVGAVLRRAVIPRLAPLIGSRRLRQAFAPAQPPPWLQAFPFSHAARPGVPLVMSAELRAFNRDMALCRKSGRELATPIHILCAPDDRVCDLQWQIGWLTEWSRTCVIHFVRGGHLLHHAQPEATFIALRSLEAQIARAATKAGDDAGPRPEGVTKIPHRAPRAQAG